MNFNNIVVIDTSTLLYDPLALFAFDQTKIVIPMVVLEEMDHAKTEKTEAGYNARLAIKFIEQISKMGTLTEGVTINDVNCGFMSKFEEKFNSILQVIPYSQKLQDPANFNLDSNDNRILSLCCVLKEKEQLPVNLVSMDVNLRLKARTLGILASDLDHHPIDQIGVKGYREESLPSMDIDFLTHRNLSDHFKLDNFKNNEYLVVKSEDNPKKKKAFRYRESTGFEEVSPYPSLWGFGPKSSAQLAALDLLLDDDVPLVFLIGPAGTGKTILTLLAGLQKVITEQRYSKFFIARPLVALGADIGFVPGDLSEKLFHWMHPFYDNLDYIFKEIDNNNQVDSFIIPRQRQQQWVSPSEKNRREKRKYYSDESKTLENSVHETVAELQKRGFLSMEAITHMRGRTLPRQFMFIDEVQNLTPQEVKTIITRAGVGTKIILAGDPYQIDTPMMDFYNNGLMATLLRLRGEELVGHVSLETSERSSLASLAIKNL